MFRLATMPLFVYMGIMLMLYYCWTSCLCNAIQIRETPSDVRMKIGSDVVFKCLVDAINGEYVRWLNHETSKFISHNGEIRNQNLSPEQQGRFSIEHKTTSQFNLHISRLLYSDRGSYECVFMHYNGQTWTMQSFSPPAIAQLTVLKEPSRDSPVCTIADEDGNDLPIGSTLQGDDHVQFQCSSRSHGSTSPNLTLFLSDTPEPKSDIVVDKIDLKTITSGVVSPRQGMEIRCVLESEALMGTKTCQLIPDVQPVVSIQPNNAVVSVGSEIKFECLASGFNRTETLEYKWDIFPEVPGNASHQVNSSSIFYITTLEEPFNSSSYLIICKVFSLNGKYSTSTMLHVQPSPPETNSINIVKASNKALAAVLPLLFLVIVVMAVLFIWRRHQKQKRNRFTGLRYTIEPSTNANTNVSIYSETRSGNIYSTGTGSQSERPFSRSSSIKENLYARYRKFRKSQVVSDPPTTDDRVQFRKSQEVSDPPTIDDSVHDTVRAIIENHRLSDIDNRLSGVDENPASIDEDGLQSNIFEDLSNDECKAHIYENVIFKSDP